jgi:WhiB family redox-sensing transcriptional regulator
MSKAEYPDFFEKGEPHCASADPDAFFPETGVGDSTTMVVLAKKICASCPYVIECLAWAMENEELGIWGGTTARERSRLRRGYTPPPRKQYDVRVKKD